MDWASAIVAGLIATAVMTALMYMGKAMGMPMDMPRMLGLMFSGPEKSGLVYALGFDWLDVDADWLWGGLFGAVHGVIAGFAFGMMPAMHPRMGPGGVLAAPGPFGMNYGAMVPMGVIVLHVVFGAIVGGVYSPT